jgi:hypothetical protein
MATNCSVLTTGYVLSTSECAQLTAGVWHNRIYLASLREITGWTESVVDNQYDDVTFGAGDGFFELVVEKDTVQWRNEYDEASKSFTHSLIFRIPDLSITARNFLQQTKGPDMVLIAQTKAGPFQILGKDSGAQLFSLVGSSEGEEVGYAVEFRASNMDELSPHFLDTDVTTTLATLAAKITTT